MQFMYPGGNPSRSSPALRMRVWKYAISMWPCSFSVHAYEVNQCGFTPIAQFRVSNPISNSIFEDFHLGRDHLVTHYISTQVKLYTFSNQYKIRTQTRTFSNWGPSSNPKLITVELPWSEPRALVNTTICHSVHFREVVGNLGILQYFSVFLHFYSYFYYQSEPYSHFLMRRDLNLY